MKRYTVKVGCGAVTKSPNNVRVSHAVKRYRLILKVLDKRALEFRVRSALQGRVQRLDDDRLIVSLLVEGKKHFGVAAPAKAALNVVQIINYAVF